MNLLVLSGWLRIAGNLADFGRALPSVRCMSYIIQNLLPIGAATLFGLLLGLAFLRIGGRALPGWRVVVPAALAEFWLAAILAGALILAPSEAGLWVMTIGSAVVIWCGFVLPALAVSLAVKGESTGRIARHVGYWLVAMLGMAVVMQLIGLHSPDA